MFRIPCKQSVINGRCSKQFISPVICLTMKAKRIHVNEAGFPSPSHSQAMGQPALGPGYVLTSQQRLYRTECSLQTLDLKKYCTRAYDRAKQNDQHGRTIDQAEVDKFSVLSKSWWSAFGEFKALHSLNELRVPWIRDTLVKQLPEGATSKTKPLTGLSILDVGCGGGILCEPLARLGASVHGIDASAENIKMAKYHASLDHSQSSVLSYECAAIEDLASSEQKFDAVVASEIIEHVSDANSFVSVCSSLVKDEGSIFFTTINKTLVSRALAVYAAEYLFKIVPAGAHDWEKFISPEDLQFMLSQNHFSTRLVHGMLLNPCTMKWSWTGDKSMNYALHATRQVV